MTTAPEKPAPLTLTPAAVARIQHLLESRGKPSLGIRIGVKTKGCSGLSYMLEYADVQMPTDEKFVIGDLVILVDLKAMMFIIGTQMDYAEDQMQSGFVFTNPNEKGRCGCGKSFHV